MSVEDRLKQLLGEQAFRIAVLTGQVDEMQKKIADLEAFKSGNGGKPLRTKGEHDVQHQSDHH